MKRNRYLRAGVIGAILAVLAACAPVSPERAAEICAERARKAAGPQAEVSIAIGSEGVDTSFAVGVSTDYLAGRDPQDVYVDCVRGYTGADPIRPLML